MTKKVICGILLIVLTTNSLFYLTLNAAGGGGAPEPVTFDGNHTHVLINATAYYSNTGLKYKTLGWYYWLEVGGRTFSQTFIQPDNQTGSGTQAIQFSLTYENPDNQYDSSTLLGLLRQKYKVINDTDALTKINDFTKVCGKLHFNAWVCVVNNSEEQGALTRKTSTYEVESTGAVYSSYTGIINAIKPLQWSTETQNALKTYYDLELKTYPVLKRTVPNISGNTTYNYGESVSLSGLPSTFNDPISDLKYFEWSYKPTSSSSWISVSSGDTALSKQNVNFGTLQPGKYDVKLTTYYKSTSYYNATLLPVQRADVESSTQTQVTVNMPSDKAYVVASGITEADKVISQADIDANKNISIMVTGIGQLENYPSTVGLSKWVVNIKKSPTGEQSRTDIKTTSLAMSSNFTTYFTIPAEVLASASTYTQKFEINATATVQGKDISSGPAYCEIKLIKQQIQKPPIAVISSKNTVMAGEPVNISGANSYAQVGSITWYDWTLSGASSNITGVSGTVTYPNEGNYTQSLTVVDSNSLTGSTSKNITVTPPTPHAVIEVSGKLKVDRVVSLDSSKSTSPQMYPIDTSKTKWTIVPVTGGSDIYRVASISSDNRPIGDPYTATICNGEVLTKSLFKTPGTYDVTLTVTNTKGYSDTVTQRITITPDLPPVAAYIVGKTFIRDQVNETGKHYAMMELTDQSYSPDGDEISKRIWRYRYDSDNDGDYTDETWVLIDDTNLTSVSIKAYDVGKYRFNLQIEEKYEP